MRLIQGALAVFFGICANVFVGASYVALRYGELFLLVAGISMLACLLTIWDLWRSGNGK